MYIYTYTDIYIYLFICIGLTRGACTWWEGEPKGLGLGPIRVNPYC